MISRIHKISRQKKETIRTIASVLTFGIQFIYVIIFLIHFGIL